MADEHTTPPSLEELLAAGEVEAAIIVKGNYTAQEMLEIRHIWSEGLRMGKELRDAEVRALEDALRFYADLDPDEIPYADTINDPPDIGRKARSVLAADPPVSGEARP